VILGLVRIPKNGAQAVVLVGVGSMLTAWISWGLGLILGAIMAREIGKHAAKSGMAVNYPLLAVAGYMGISLTFGWGLFSSAGLLQAEDGNALMQLGFLDRVIPATEWVFHAYPLTLTALSIVYVSIMLYLLSPRKQNCRPIGYYVDLEPGADARNQVGPHGSADSDVDQEFYDAVKGSAGVVLLFPFYARIIGGTLNLLVPLAGGEWAIIGGPMMMAGAELGIPHGQTIAAYAVGDAHTNLLNPFWAIPLLAITGLRARDMLGYAITMMILPVRCWRSYSTFFRTEVRGVDSGRTSPSPILRP
jgi:short subunit fatty acids transporter